MPWIAATAQAEDDLLASILASLNIFSQLVAAVAIATTIDVAVITDLSLRGIAVAKLSQESENDNVDAFFRSTVITETTLAVKLTLCPMVSISKYSKEPVDVPNRQLVQKRPRQLWRPVLPLQQ